MQTSIHIRPVVAGSEQHNRREKALDYVRPDLIRNNEHWQSDTQASRLAEIKGLVKDLTGRSLQDKATPIREGVVVIKPETTMEDLHKLADQYRQLFGIDVFQISIHRDEGHMEDGQWKRNLHAHMVVDWMNHDTGKSIKLRKDDMVKMQTITAEILGMERGVSSDKKHLDAIAFKIAEKEKQKKQIEAEITNLNNMKEQKQQELKAEEDRISVAKQGKNAFSAVLSRVGEKFNEKSMTRTIDRQNEEIKALTKQVKDLQGQLSKMAEELRNKREKMKDIDKGINRSFQAGKNESDTIWMDRYGKLNEQLQTANATNRTLIDALMKIPTIKKAAEMVVEIAMSHRRHPSEYQRRAIERAIDLAPDSKNTITNAIGHVAQAIKPSTYGAADWVENTMRMVRGMAEGAEESMSAGLRR